MKKYLSHISILAAGITWGMIGLGCILVSVYILR